MYLKRQHEDVFVSYDWAMDLSKTLFFSSLEMEISPNLEIFI